MIFMFSGQGSQYYQMARELFDGHRGFRERMIDLDGSARRLRGRSVLEHIYQDDRKIGDFCAHLEFSHPAIFMLEYSLAQVLIDAGVTPAYLLGASMGEYASCAVAGALRVEDALEALFHQIDVVQARCAEGGMLTIFHDPALYDQTPALCENSELAGVNFDKHFVVSGKREGLRHICDFLRRNNILFQELPATYAFHSSLMDPAAETYRAFLRTKALRRPSIPLASCRYGRIITELDDDYLWGAVRRPILLREAVAAIEERREGLPYVDLGPAGTLASFVKYNLGKQAAARIFAVVTAFAQDSRNLEKVMSRFARGSVDDAPAQALVDHAPAQALVDHAPAQALKKRKSMRALVFPGQGSQRKGMGAALFGEFPEIVSEADDILGYSIRQLCLENPDNQLGQTQYTQPALYVVNALTHLHLARAASGLPDFAAGHSLGEYNALLAAGAFDFATGLKLVRRRGELMAKVEGGGMAAIIGLSEVSIQRVIEEHGLDTVEIANYNSPTQIVISGLRETIERARPLFEAAGARSYILLPVSGAFHSRYMQPAKEELTAFLRQFQYSELKIPVVSNAEAGLYTRDRVVELLAKQLTQPVRWTETVQFLLRQGTEEFVEAGPGNVLTKVIHAIRQAPLAAATPDPAAGRDPGSAAAEDGAMGRYEAPVRAVPVDRRVATATALRPAAAPPTRVAGVAAAALGDAAFKRDYGARYAYAAGGLPRGISSPALVLRMARAGLLSFVGTGWLTPVEIEDALVELRRGVADGQPYGATLVCDPISAEAEEATVDLLLRHRIKNVEAVGYLHVTPALVRYRLKGLRGGPGGAIDVGHRVLARVSRPEVTDAFLSPAPERVIRSLLDAGAVTRGEAELAGRVPMADDVCLEPDCVSNVDSLVLLPVAQSLREAAASKFGHARRVRIGVGAIGTPAAAAAAFLLGADFISTGAVNQCTVEARLGEPAKQLLEQASVQDTESVPVGEVFETGARTQVLRKGLFFPARANKLYQLYRQHDAIEQLSARDRQQIEEKIFRRSLQGVYEEIVATLARSRPREIEKAERNQKHKMALIFRRYFEEAHGLAARGDEERRVDYQVCCDPSMGAFNQWARGSALERWRDRHVDDIAEALMGGADDLLSRHRPGSAERAT